MSQQITRDEWLTALGKSTDPGDPDALTGSELAKLLGVTYRQAMNYAERLVVEGKAIKTFKRTKPGPAGGRSDVIAFKLLKKVKR